MAALAVQNVSAGGPVTTAAASAGGDTVVGGIRAGGWGLTTFLLAVVGATATTITVGGVAYGPYTSQTVMIPLNVGVYQTNTTAVTYSQVTGVTVGAVTMAPSA